jgi:hypothetical protein
MAYSIDAKYKDGLFLFPSKNIDPKLKLRPEYIRKVAEAIYCTYVGDKCAVPYTYLNSFNEVRLYADGKQDPTKYEENLVAEINSSGQVLVGDTISSKANRRKGDGNINKEILSLAPRIMQALLGAFEKVDYNLLADTIDPDSGYEKDRAKSSLYAESQNLDFINGFKQQAGIPIQTDTKYPKDLDELQLMEDLGEFKTGVAKALEKLLEHTYDISDWKNDIIKLIKDIACFNAICLKDYYDDEECKWKTCYEDITRVVAQYSDKRDYKDSSYFGVIREYTISEIRHYLEGRYSEDDIKSLAQSWSGELGNPYFTEWKTYNQLDTYGSWKYDFYKVCVFDFTWVENDNIYKTINTSENGTRTVYDQKYGRMRNSDHNQTMVTTLKKRYEAKWVIGTDIVFQEGIARSQPKNKSNKYPLMPYHIYIGTEKAIIQRLIPVFDHFQIAWLKLQDALVKAWPDMILLDATVTERSKIKGEEWDTIKMLNLARKTHTFVYRSLPFSGKYPGGNTKPIDLIPSTIINRIDEATKLFENCIRMTELVTGINPLVLGQQPSGQEGLGTSEIAIQNTAKILKPIIDSIFSVKENSAIFLSEAIRLAIRNDEKCYNAYAKVVGINDVDALKQSEYEARELGIKLIPRPDSEEMKSLYQDIESAALPGKSGEPLIDFATKMYIKEKLMRGANLSDLRLYLSNAIEKNKQRQEQNQMQAIQMQGQQNAQLQQAKTQGELQKVQLDAQAQMAIDNNKYDREERLQAMKMGHENIMKEKELQNAE